MTIVYTFGHSNHKPDALLELLEKHEIKAVVDVRSSPYSRYVPQANRETISAALRASGIAYHWFGDQLGGKPQGTVADYEQLRGSRSFLQGITKLVAVAEANETAIMCAEGDHRRCHRHRLIAPVLVDKGIQVVHIRTDGSLADEDSEPRQRTLC